MKAKNTSAVLAIVGFVFGGAAQATAAKPVHISPNVSANAPETIASDASRVSDVVNFTKPTSPCDAPDSKRGYGASPDSTKTNDNDSQPANPYMGVGDGD
jgi:hypothetical protein